MPKPAFIKCVLPAATVDHWGELLSRFPEDAIDVMPSDQIHITVVFLGSCMKGMGRDRRAELASKVERGFRFFPLELEFVGFELWGKNNNLLVARFSLAPHQLREVIRFKESFEAFGAPHETTFVPHITLGKVASSHLSAAVQLAESFGPAPNIVVGGFALCAP